MKVGAQMYTVRDFCKTLEDFEQTLKRLADIGFRYVQVSGSCPFAPEWLADKLNKYGLQCTITHTNREKLFADPQQVSDDHAVYGCNYVGLGSMPNLYNQEMTIEEVAQAFLRDAKEAMRILRQNGKLLMYHNHFCEFVKLPDGRNMFDVLSESTGADELGFTLDMYWVQYGGANPVDVIRKLAGRIPCVHFKDYKILRQKEKDRVRMAPVGEGNLNWDAIIAACEDAGAKYAFIEQDDTYGEDPFDCLKRSFDYLVSKGLEIQ